MSTHSGNSGARLSPSETLQRYDPNASSRSRLARALASAEDELERQRRQRPRQPGQHLVLHALDVDLDEVGHAVRGDQASSVVAGTSTRSSQRTHAKDGTRVASAMKPGDAVVTVGVRELTSSVALPDAADRLGAHGDLQVATEQPAEEAREVRLRLDPTTRAPRRDQERERCRRGRRCRSGVAGGHERPVELVQPASAAGCP